MNLNEAISHIKDRLKVLANKVDLNLTKEQLIFLWLRVRDRTGYRLERLYHTAKNTTAALIRLIRHYSGIAAGRSRIIYQKIAAILLVFVSRARVSGKHFSIKAYRHSVTALRLLKHYLKILLELIIHLALIIQAFLVIAGARSQRIIKQSYLWSAHTTRVTAGELARRSKQLWRFVITHLKYSAAKTAELAGKSITALQQLTRVIVAHSRVFVLAGYRNIRTGLITGWMFTASVLTKGGVLLVALSANIRVLIIALIIRSLVFVAALSIDTWKRLAAFTRAGGTYTKILAQMIDEGFTGIGEYIYIALEFIVVNLYRALRGLLRLPVVIIIYTDRLISRSLFALVTSVRWILTGLVRAVIYTLKTPVIVYGAVIPEAVAARLKLYAQLIRLDKPIGTFLLLWPTLLALWLAAEGWPDLKILLIFIAGVFLMRSAGCAINDFADREFDINVKRTRDRPLAAGKISEKEALAVFVVLAVIAFILVLQLNDLAIGLSLIGVVLVASYPFMKRYHYIPQAHLGVAFGWAVPMAWAAQANELTPVAGLLFFATVLWTTAYDTMYAMVDYDDDIKIGVKSTAILFGNADRIIIGIIQALLILDLVLIGLRLELTGFYYTGVTLAVTLAAWQQYLIKDREPTLCFRAFLNNNWFGVVLFAGLFCEYQFGGIT